jgi:hypothetical protein
MHRNLAICNKKIIEFATKKFPKIWVADLDLLEMAPKPKGN